MSYGDIELGEVLEKGRIGEIFGGGEINSGVRRENRERSTVIE